jgi:hypothetical protein
MHKNGECAKMPSADTQPLVVTMMAMLAPSLLLPFVYSHIKEALRECFGDKLDHMLTPVFLWNQVLMRV